METKYLRHGDLSFREVEQLPELTKEGEKVEKEAVLAEGEHTGHYHKLTATKEDVDLLIHEAMEGMVIEIRNGDAVLTHQEHDPITFTEGIYVMKVEREYDYFLDEIKEVID